LWRKLRLLRTQYDTLLVCGIATDRNNRHGPQGLHVSDLSHSHVGAPRHVMDNAA
jgi:hypothetical protein